MSKFTTELTKISITDQERKCLEYIDTQEAGLVEQLILWSHVNSGSQNRVGLREMRGLIVEAFSQLPGILTEPELGKGEYVANSGEVLAVEYEPAILLSVRPEAEVQVVLTGHYDTVFPKDSDFQTTDQIDADTLGGPGVADMKGGILVMLNALLAFEKSKNFEKIGYSVLLSPDEEIGSPGSAPLLAELGRKSHIGLTYEPSLSDGSMAGARKGSGNFTLCIRGRAAHAGREHHLGRNAIVAMARFAVALDGLNGVREGVTFNLAKIDGGGAVNIVPDLAVGRFNVRMLVEEDQDWIRAQIEALVVDINTQDGLSAELTGRFTRPPKPMAPANALVFDWVKQAGTALGMEIKWKPSGGVCEGNNLWASGCPNVDTLGVRGGEIHSDREFMKLSSLVERAKLSTLILMKIASGEFDAKQAKTLAQGKMAQEKLKQEGADHAHS
ncbi:MAG: acetylornithine deacetylase [Robiginitomaculum sp.]|nr:MAG: acetylornithine deacetylase [Robiginitomaculum sp.]